MCIKHALFIFKLENQIVPDILNFLFNFLDLHTSGGVFALSPTIYFYSIAFILHI